LFSCEELPVLSFDNPLDLTTAEELNIELPAIVFYPDSIPMEAGTSAQLQVFAMEVTGLSGAHIQINYEQQKLNLKSVTKGEFLNSLTDPGFFFENDTIEGLLDIYTISFGEDSLKNVTGTGSLAIVEFEATAPGKIILEYTDKCEFVDENDNPIEIKSLLYGVLDVAKKS